MILWRSVCSTICHADAAWILWASDSDELSFSCFYYYHVSRRDNMATTSHDSTHSWEETQGRKQYYLRIVKLYYLVNTVKVWYGSWMSSLSVKAYGIVERDFCPLAMNISRFSNGFCLKFYITRETGKKLWFNTLRANLDSTTLSHTIHTYDKPMTENCFM